MKVVHILRDVRVKGSKLEEALAQEILWQQRELELVLEPHGASLIVYIARTDHVVCRPRRSLYAPSSPLSGNGIHLEALIDRENRPEDNVLRAPSTAMRKLVIFHTRKSI